MGKRARWILLLMLIALASRVGAYTIPYETWMGAYIGEKKVGYLSLKIEQADYDGIKGYRIANVLNNHLTVLGADLNQLVTTVVRTDESFAPLIEDFSMASGGKTTRVRATFHKDTIECVISAGSGSRTQTVPIPEGANLIGDSLFAVPDIRPEIGSEHKMHYFNPLTLSVEELTVKIERRERIEVGGKQYDAIILKNITPMGEMTVWQEPGGEMLQVQAVMGIRMVRQTEKEAMSGIETGAAQDFAVLTSVKPSKPIPSPRELKKLDIVLKGLDGSRMAISDSRQKAAPIAGDPDAVEFVINAATFDKSKSVERPVTDPALQEELSATAYLDHDLSAVTNQAREIVGDEKSAYQACSKIRAWVFANMKTDPGIGITRSASDVLKSRVGVCRDYAILFAALARSVGIPARVAAGLIYTNGGFYYHAWVECYVGQWVPFDATLPTDFVDATHIKLAEGDATAMFGLARVIGNLKADVNSLK